MDKQGTIIETKADFQSADEWSKKYRPLKQKGGDGIRDLLGGTMHDAYGAGRAYVNRAGVEFAWAVLNNGFFDYLQNGFHAEAVGYLVTDNPVRYTDEKTRYAVEFDHIDWTSFEHFQNTGEGPGAEVAVEDPASSEEEPAAAETPSVGVVAESAQSQDQVPEYSTELEEVEHEAQAEAVVEVDPRLFAPVETPQEDFEAVPESVRNIWPSAHEATEHHPAYRHVEAVVEEPGGQAAEHGSVEDMLASYPGIAPEAETVSEVEEEPVLAEGEAATYAEPENEDEELVADGYAGVASVETSWETQPIEPSAEAGYETATYAPVESAEEYLPSGEYEGAEERQAQYVGESLADTEAVPAGTATEGAQEYAYTPEQEPGEAVDEPEHGAYATEYPAVAEPQHVTEESYYGSEWTEAAPPEPIGFRQIPIGREAAQADYEAYGYWPEAVECTGCRGNGYYAGIAMSEIGCERCDERGWNPPEGGPKEIPVYASHQE